MMCRAIPRSHSRLLSPGGRPGSQGLPGEESLEEVAKLAVADMAMRSNIRKVTDPQEIVPVLMAAW
jgi:hypothetical protein